VRSSGGGGEQIWRNEINSVARAINAAINEWHDSVASLTQGCNCITLLKCKQATVSKEEVEQLEDQITYRHQDECALSGGSSEIRNDRWPLSFPCPGITFPHRLLMASAVCQDATVKQSALAHVLQELLARLKEER